jgi:hypothetical protein
MSVQANGIGSTGYLRFICLPAPLPQEALVIAPTQPN